MTTSLRQRRYDAPNYTLRRYAHLVSTKATASVVHAQFDHPATVKIHRVFATAMIAGTTETNTYTVRTATTSVGLLTLADSAIDYSDSADLDLTLTTGTSLNFLKGTDATGQASFCVEYSIPVGTTLPA